MVQQYFKNSTGKLEIEVSESCKELTIMIRQENTVCCFVLSELDESEFLSEVKQKLEEVQKLREEN